MKLRIALFLLLGWLFLLHGCLFPTVVTKEDDGRLVTLDRGDLLVVRLEGNPSSGYEWELVDPLDQGVLEQVGEREFVSEGNDDIVGAPGTFVFRFRAVASGTIPLQFVYERPWEEEPIETFSVVVYVR